MVRGFVDMEPSVPPDGSAARLQVGAALRLDSVLAMRVPWRALSEECDLPTAQFEWAVAAMNQVGPRMQAHVAYVSDGSNLRAVLPLFVRPRYGVEHLQYMAPSLTMPIDIPHADKPSLEQLIRSIVRLGKPVYLARMLDSSPATKLLREMADQKRAVIRFDRSTPTDYIALAGFALQDRAQNAARVSIIAASFGLSGGPNDVIFQFVSPSLDQVMTLFHESLQLQNGAAPPNKKATPRKEMDAFEFVRTYAFHCAQRGEIRFSCLRLAGRLLAVQVFQVRRKTAWLLHASNLDRFRSTTLSTLLMHETIRKFQHENIDQMILPSGGAVAELGEYRKMPCVDVRIYPWGPRSMMAMVLSNAGRASAGLLRQREVETGPDSAPAQS